MYVIPFIVVLLIALAIFFSPLLAVILLVVALLGLGGIKFFGGATEPENAPPPHEANRWNAEAAGEKGQDSERESGGLWGEQWPEERRQ